MTSSDTTINPPDSNLTSPNQGRSNLVPGVSDEMVREVLAFESSIPELARVYRKKSWDPERELEILIAIVSDPDEKTDTRLRAMKELQIRRNEILQSCGLKVKATRVKTDKAGVSTVTQADIVMAAFGFGMEDNPAPELEGVIDGIQENKLRVGEPDEGDRPCTRVKSSLQREGLSSEGAERADARVQGKARGARGRPFNTPDTKPRKYRGRPGRKKSPETLAREKRAKMDHRNKLAREGRKRLKSAREQSST